MTEKILRFYEPLAEHYHLIFDDWNRTIERQAGILQAILSAEGFAPPARVLDCACGIGTQALGFAALGYQVVATDVSGAAVKRALREARVRKLDITFHVSDMTNLAEVKACDFDVVVAMDNALPHLNPVELASALKAAAARLKPGGLFLASIRDYDTLIRERPTMQSPAFHGIHGERRMVHQVWDWIDQARYTLHLFITQQSDEAWKTLHFVSEYRCLLREELSLALQASGFHKVRWLMPSESGFYQPLVLATHP